MDQDNNEQGAEPTRPIQPSEPTTSFEAPVQGPAAPAGGNRQPPRRGKILAAVLIGLVVLAGAAAAFAFFMLRGTSDQLTKMVPADSQVYVTAYLDPAASQKVNLKRAASRFPALQGDLGSRFAQYVDRALAPVGLTFERDVHPWLGSQVAVTGDFAPGTPNGTSFAILIASKDDQAAEAALAKATARLPGASSWKTTTHGGLTIHTGTTADGSPTAYGMVDHTLVIANGEPLLDRIIDTDQGVESGLADSSDYSEATSSLPDGVLGVAYVDLRPLFGFLAQASARLGPAGQSALAGNLAAFKSFAVSLRAESTGIEVDDVLTLDRSKLTQQQQKILEPGVSVTHLVDGVPENAYGFLALGNFKQVVGSFLQNAASLGPQAQALMQNLDVSGVLEHVSGAALEVTPGAGATPSGAFLIETDDPPVMRTFLDGAARAIVQQATGGGGQPSFQTQTYKDVEIKSVSVPSGTLPEGVAPSYAVTDDLAIIGASPDAVKAVIDAEQGGGSIRESPNYKLADAQASGYDQSMFYLDIEAVTAAARASMSPQEAAQFDATALPNLRPLKSLIVAGEISSDRIPARLFLAIP
jgi:hypothetical protein